MSKIKKDFKLFCLPGRQPPAHLKGEKYLSAQARESVDKVMTSYS